MTVGHLQTLTHEVTGMVMTREESVRLLHRFDYSNHVNYITYDDFCNFLINDGRKGRYDRLQYLKMGRVLKCATLVMR